MEREQWNPLSARHMFLFLERHSVPMWAVMKDQELGLWRQGQSISVKPGEWVMIHSDGRIEIAVQ